MTLYMITNS